MANLLIYVFILMLVLCVSFMNTVNLGNTQKKKSLLVIKEDVNQYTIKAPIWNLLLITLILSLYSAALATSGNLSDTVRYAWSFTYRYPYYYDSFEGLMNSNTEIGFLLLLKIINYFSNENFLIFLIIAIITTFINLYVASKISRHYTTVIFLYMVSMYFFQSTYLLRQAIAVSFANLAILSYLRNKSVFYVLYTLIAITFHTTAVVLLPALYLFKKAKDGISFFWLFLIMTLTVFFYDFIVINIFSSIYFIEPYLNFDDQLTGTVSSLFKGIPFYFLTLVAIMKRKDIKKMVPHADFYIVCSVIYSLSILMSLNMYWLFRLGWYFLLPTLSLLPLILKTHQNKNERILFLLAFVFPLILITARQIYITLN